MPQIITCLGVLTEASTENVCWLAGLLVSLFVHTSVVVSNEMHIYIYIYTHLYAGELR